MGGGALTLLNLGVLVSDMVNDMWMIEEISHSANLITLAVSCGTPSFGIRMDVEPFTNTTVGSQVVYRCQSGLLPEGRRTSVCGEDGMWNPNPATLMCKGKTYV